MLQKENHSSVQNSTMEEPKRSTTNSIKSFAMCCLLVRSESKVLKNMICKLLAEEGFYVLCTYPCDSNDYEEDFMILT